MGILLQKSGRATILACLVHSVQLTLCILIRYEFLYDVETWHATSLQRYIYLQTGRDRTCLADRQVVRLPLG